MGVNNLPRVAAWRCTGWERSRVQHANHYTTKPPNSGATFIGHNPLDCLEATMAQITMTAELVSK